MRFSKGARTLISKEWLYEAVLLPNMHQSSLLRSGTQQTTIAIAFPAE